MNGPPLCCVQSKFRLMCDFYRMSGHLNRDSRGRFVNEQYVTATPDPNKTVESTPGPSANPGWVFDTRVSQNPCRQQGRVQGLR